MRTAGGTAEHSKAWTATGTLLRTPKVVRYAAGLGVPVLLHHGFLIDFNSLWHRSGVVQQLAM